MRKSLAIVAAISFVASLAVAAEVPVIPASKPVESSTPPVQPAAAPSEAKPETKAETASAPAATPTETAQAAPPPKKGIYEGMFTFDWKRLTKCQIVGPITNAMLTDPKNICKKADKETGGPASCKVSDKSEYLIFKTLADCKVEYEEQVKAAP